MFFPRELRIQKAIDRKTLARLERLARRMEPALRDGFLAAIQSAKSQITLNLLEQSLAAIDPAAAIRVATGGLEFERMRETLAQLVEASGVRATESLIRVTGEAIASFDLTNPYAVQYARREVGRLITEITQSTQEGIQRLIENGIEEGVDVRSTARQIRDRIGLTSQQQDWVINYENRLYARGAVDIDSKVQRYANKVLNYRSRTIARTESLDALNAGQQAAWNAAVDQGMLPPEVEQEWILSPDACPEICAPIPELDENQHVGLNGVFITGEGNRIKKPPAHPNCKCAVALRL